METRENQRIELTKRLLKESPLELLQKKDIDKISVRELCEKAGINRTTFYRHYGCPHDVLTQIEDDLIAGIPTLNSVRDLSSRELFLKQSCMFWEYREDHRDLARILLMNESTESGFARKLFNMPVMDQAISTAVRQDYDETTSHLILVFLKSGAYNLLKEWTVCDLPNTPEEMGQLVLDLVLESGWIKRSLK